MSGQPHDKVAALKVAISASISLAVMIVDFGWLMRDEVKYVWPRLRTSWTARIYVLTRYVGMASQIFNIYFAVRMYLGTHTSHTGCRLWFAYQALVVQFLLAFVEGMLMHRTYALFLRSRLVLSILISFALAQMASMVVSGRFSLASKNYTVTCLMVRSNPGNAFFSTTMMTTNVVIFFMTFWRYFQLPVKWARQGMGRVIFRDSALSLGAISMMMLFMTLCSLEVIKPSMSGNITYYWFVCILWISIGRMIVNQEKIRRDEGEQEEGNTWRGTLQLTSQIEMGESTLRVDTQCGSSDGHTPTTSTLQSSLGTPMTKASELSPSSVCTSSDDARTLLGDHPFPYGHRHEQRLSNMELPVEVFVPDANQLSLSSVCTSDGDAPRTGDHPRADADADADEHGHCPSPSPSLSPQPSRSELPPLEMSS